jgi:hypothetical protein
MKTLNSIVSVILLMLVDSTADRAASSNTWVTVFDERFADNPQQCFTMLPVPRVGSTGSGSSSRYDQERKSFSVGGYLSLVRPIQAGPQVLLDLSLRFDPPDTNEPPTMVTAFKFMLVNRSLVGVEIERSNSGDVPVRVKFVQETPDQPSPKILRELKLETPSLNGEWQLGFCHGLLTLRQGNQALGGADTGNLGVQVVGVSWTQKGGQVTCERMTLTGEPIPETSSADQETLQRAARLNQEAQSLFREGKPTEALGRMKEASALFVLVRGEDHYDSANSFANLAAFTETSDKAEATKLWTKVLAIHEKTLGPTHPHTTLTRFNLGKCFMEQGNSAKAKGLWTRCRDDWQAVLGADYSLVKSLDVFLPTM